MKPARYIADEEITARRLKRFDAFRATLPEAERACLDAKIERWVGTIKKCNPSIPFSVNYARELFMALVEMEGFIQKGE